MSKKFPDDFDYYGGPNTKVRNEDDINCDVQRVKKWLKKQERETPDDYTAFIIASGDTIVFGYRTDECKVINVCQGYHELDYAYKE